MTSRIPVVMYWGPNFTVLYNDPYTSFLGETKHPRYLGEPARECWSEVWDTIGPMKAAQVLAENPQDIPFAAIYLVDKTGTGAKLSASARLVAGVHPFPLAVSAADHDPSPFPLASVLQTQRAEETAELDMLATRLPGGLWPEPTSKALTLPIPAPTHDRLAGLLIAGMSPRRVLDAAYRTFFDFVAGHIGTAITDARKKGLFYFNLRYT